MIDSDSLLARTLAAIVPVDEDARAAAEARQLTLTKPPGSLGRLETLGNQLSAISGQCPPPAPTPALVGVFAGDHGVQAGQRVSPWPQDVSRQMAANIALGGAAVSVLARNSGADVRVFDVGLLAPVDLDAVRDVNVRRGTDDFTEGPAMSIADAVAGLEVGIRAADQAYAQGYRCLVMGEVGIGNTTRRRPDKRVHGSRRCHRDRPGRWRRRRDARSKDRRDPQRYRGERRHTRASGGGTGWRRRAGARSDGRIRAGRSCPPPAGDRRWRDRLLGCSGG